MTVASPSETTHRADPESRAKRTAICACAMIVLTHAGLFALPFVGVSMAAVLVTLGLYVIKGIGGTVSYHRLLAHRSFRTDRVTQTILVFLGVLSLQGGPLWWIATHRLHHRKVDTKEDPHAPANGGFLFAHLTWMLRSRAYELRGSKCDDWARFPEIRFLNRHALVIGLSPIAVLGIIGFYAPATWRTSAWQMIVWGHAVSQVITWHWVWSINSICHLVGSQPESENNSSRNVWWLCIPSFGESWHNNHHRYSSSARFGLKWYQLDPGWWCILVLEQLGLAKDVLAHPEHGHLRPRFEPSVGDSQAEN